MSAFSLISSIGGQLGVYSDSVLRKAEELIRIAEVRSVGNSLPLLTSTSTAVMCLELAAFICGHHVDRSTAIRVSGLPKKSYTSCIKVMERILELQSTTSIPDLAVQFGCTEARSMAAYVLTSYQESQSGRDWTEISQSLFNTAALYTSCRKLKIRVDKMKMVTVTGAGRSTFDRLVNQMDGFADKFLDMHKKDASVGNARNTKNLADNIALLAESESNTTASKSSVSHSVEEPFEVWKKRILKQAYQAVKESGRIEAC